MKIDKKAEKRISSFVTDDNLLRAVNYTRSISFLDIIKINEEAHSTILAWLFNPYQGHGLNDLAIKELLKTCFRDVPDLYKREVSFFEDYALHQIDVISFANTYVRTEFQAGPSKNGKGKHPAIDIALINPENKIMIFIENKFGAPEGKNQKKKYHDYLSKKYEGKYHCIFVYLDYNYDGDGMYPPWISLNYDWIKTLLKTVLDHGSCHPAGAKMLTDYYIHLSEDYEYDPFFTGSETAIKALSKAHPDVPEIFSDLPDWDFAQKDEDKSEEAFQHLYDKYYYIIDQMDSYDELDILGEELSKALNFSGHNLIDIGGRKRKYLAITCPLFKQWSEKNKEGYWPIFITYTQNQGANAASESSDSNPVWKIEIFIDLNLVPHEFQEDMRSMIQKETERVKPRYNRIKTQTFTVKPTNEDLIAAFRQRYNQLLRWGQNIVG